MEHGLEWRRYLFSSLPKREAALSRLVYTTMRPLLYPHLFSSSRPLLLFHFIHFHFSPPFQFCFLKTAEHVPSFRNQASRQNVFRLCLFPSLSPCHCEFLVTRLVQSHSFPSGAPVTPL